MHTTIEVSEETYISPQQLARRWSVREDTLAHHRVNGTGLPFYRIGGRVRYALTDVLAHERGHRFTSTRDREAGA